MALRTSLIFLILALLLALVAPCLADSVGATSGANAAKSTLDANTMQQALRTANPNEEAYITYVCALVDRGVLTRRMVVGTFQWARGRPYPLKAQSFKFGVITRAAKLGIRLARGTPSLRPDISGRVVINVLGRKIPVADATVSIKGTERTTKTNAKGHFAFTNLPYGSYTVEAAKQIPFPFEWTGSVRVGLPNSSPTTQSVSIEIELKPGS